MILTIRRMMATGVVCTFRRKTKDRWRIGYCAFSIRGEIAADRPFASVAYGNIDRVASA